MDLSSAGSPLDRNYIFEASNSTLESAHEYKLPVSNLTCPLQVQIKDVHQIFQQTAAKLGFGIIEAEENFSTAVYRKCCSIKRVLSLCCPVQDHNITAVKLEVSLNEAKCVRQIKVKGVYGVSCLLALESNAHEEVHRQVLPSIQQGKENESGGGKRPTKTL